MTRRHLKQGIGVLALAATLLPLVVSAQEEATPRQWLQRMAAAAHQLNYEGTFVYSHDGHMQSMRIVHGYDGGHEKERLLSLSGPSREVLRDDEQVTCILPDDNEVVVERSGPRRPLAFKQPTSVEQLEKYYTLNDGGDERVAGFMARKIVITPRDRYRYGHTFWLHGDNGLLLRSDLVNDSGKVIEQMMFTSLNLFDSLPEKLLQPQTEGRDVVWQRQSDVSDQVGTDVPWRVEDLPPGFVMDSHRRHAMPGNHALVEHVVYTDGLASVSVFVEREEGDNPGFIGSSRIGAVSAYARIADGYHVTVVGEVPPVTVKQMAESVVRQSGAGQ